MILLPVDFSGHRLIRLRPLATEHLSMWSWLLYWPKTVLIFNYNILVRRTFSLNFKFRLDNFMCVRVCGLATRSITIEFAKSTARKYAEILSQAVLIIIENKWSDLRLVDTSFTPFTPFSFVVFDVLACWLWLEAFQTFQIEDHIGIWAVVKTDDQRLLAQVSMWLFLRLLFVHFSTICQLLSSNLTSHAQILSRHNNKRFFEELCVL